MISVVFPAYNEEKNVRELHRQLKRVLDSMKEPYEIIAVENGSQDNTLAELKKCSPVKIIVFPKNMGQTLALDAGIHAAKGEIAVILDADLQNDPRDIPVLVNKLREGFGAVQGWRKNRKDTPGRRILSKLANWLTNKVMGLSLHDHACALKVFKKEFLGDVHLYGEMHVFLVAILSSRGARVAEVPVMHHERIHGLSKHNFKKAVKDIADLFAVKFIFSYSSRPMLFFGGWGAVSIIVGFLASFWALILKIMELRNFGQTPLPIVSALFIILGFILFMMGFLGELMLRVYYESGNKKPYYIMEIIDLK